MSRSKGFTYEHARQAVMADALVFGLGEELFTLLVQRDKPPYKGRWAIPGGHVKIHETLEEAVVRTLLQKTGVGNLYLEQLHTFSGVKRDPREPTISVVFCALARPEQLELEAGGNARAVRWFSVDNLPPLAFDHAAIIRMGVEHLRERVRYRPVGFKLLPETFTMGQLRTMYEQILGVELHKANFRRDVLKAGIVVETADRVQHVSHRPPTLYRFASPEKSGFQYKSPV